MAPISLETEDHSRDAAFNKAMHGKSAEEKAGFRAMLKKDAGAQKAAVDEYFKHWDNKSAGTETQEVREVGSEYSFRAEFLQDADILLVLGPESRIRYADPTVSFTRRNSIVERSC